MDHGLHQSAVLSLWGGVGGNIRIDYLSAIDCALAASGKGALEACVLSNESEVPWRGVLVRILGPNLVTSAVFMPSLPQHASVDLAADLSVRFCLSALSALQQPQQELATVTVFVGGVCVLEHDCAVQLVPAGEGGDFIADAAEEDGSQLLPEVKVHDRYDLSLPDAPGVELTKFDIWERKLLDFSLRNSLLNINFRSKKLVQLLVGDLAKVEDEVQRGGLFSVETFPAQGAMPKGKPQFQSSEAWPMLKAKADSALYKKKVYAFLGDEDLRPALTKIYRTSRTSMEENGANSLYLVVGLLQWRESETAEQNRYAPLLLVPIEMVRTGHTFRVRDEETTLNVTLIEYLKKLHGIDLSGLQSLPKDDSGVDVAGILGCIRRQVSVKKGWDVLEESLIGIFQFNKFVMWNDIHVGSQLLQQNPIVGALVSGVLAQPGNAEGANAKIGDAIMRPSELLVPIDVDSSQLEAVMASGSGESFILHGPPGTGKSQTITNIIANALYGGKRVLFVAEKMAALEVVKSRLEKIGLGPFCLELHSNKATKKHFLQQLADALNAPRLKPVQEFDATSDRLFEHRSQIISMVEALHSKNAMGVSLFDLIMRYLAIDAEPMAANVEPFRGMSLADIDILKTKIEKLNTVLSVVGKPSQSPWRSFVFTDFSAEAESKVAALVPAIKADYESLDDAEEEFERQWGFPPPVTERGAEWLGAFADLLETVPLCSGKYFALAFNSAHRLAAKSALEQCEKSLTLADHIIIKLNAGGGGEQGYERIKLAKLAAEKAFDEWTAIKDKWFLPRFFASRAFLKRMAKAAAKTISEADLEEVGATLHSLEKCDSDYMANLALLEECFGPLSPYSPQETAQMKAALALLPQVGASAKELAEMMQTNVQTVTDFWEKAVDRITWSQKSNPLVACAKALAKTAKDIKNDFDSLALVAKLPAPTDEIVPDLRDKISDWAAAPGMLHNWLLWSRTAKEYEQLGLQPAVLHVEVMGVSARQAADAWAKGVFRDLAREMIRANDSLAFFHGDIFNDTIEQYRKLTSAFRLMSKAELVRKLSDAVPRSSIDNAASSEVNILKRNINNGGRGMSIRSIIDQIPTLMPRLCPCMLMSPISVAQYIDLAGEKFDIVVFDEASQMPTSEAVGAIARGKSLVVVGDPKQMPPTSLFNVSAVDEEESALDDLDSILDDCISLSMPSKYLTWHYRSRHESLIAFSNAQYYGGMLTTFPSADDSIRKVTFRYIADGIYDRGASRTNAEEAEAIVDEIVRRVSSPELRGQSIGVVSFNIHQRDLIEDRLTDRISGHPDLENILYNGAEPIFIKNLENVQGDERDVILFSVGFGPDKNGKVYMSFGPLTKKGGERRLNVAVSRARCEMQVFSSLLPEHISLRPGSGEGLVGLKRFLEFARTGQTLATRAQLYDADSSQLAHMIADALKLRGYQSRVGVGRSGFKVDVAVVDPDNPSRFLLAILCDGPGYYATKTVRDREVVQPQVLGALNWNVMRVWTLDWLNRPTEVVGTIVDEIERLRKAPSDAVVKVEEQDDYVQVSDEEVQPEEALCIPYTYAELQPLSVASVDFLPRHIVTVRKQLQTIIDAEAPVTNSVLYKRIVAAWGLSRQSKTVVEVVDRALVLMKSYFTPNYTDSVTYWKSKEQADNYPFYRCCPNRDIIDVPSVEIVNALRHALRQSGSMLEDDLKRVCAQMLGFNRRGAVIDGVISTAITVLEDTGQITRLGNRLAL